MSSRDAILRRRARFVSAALVLAGCHRAEESKAKAVPAAESKSAAKPAEPKPPPPVKPPPDRPELGAKVSVAGEAGRAAAAVVIEKIEKSVSELAGAIPAGCDLSDPICRGRFKIFAEQLARIREDLFRLTPPGCPPKRADDKAIAQLKSVHRAWLEKWVDQIESAGRGAVDAIGDSGTVWEDLRSVASSAYAHPCLSFYCPP